LYCSKERLNIKEKEKGYRQNILPVVAIEVSKEYVETIATSCKFMMLIGLMIKEKSFLRLCWVNLEKRNSGLTLDQVQKCGREYEVRQRRRFAAILYPKSFEDLLQIKG